MKENIIIGHLIPAGLGSSATMHIELEPPTQPLELLPGVAPMPEEAEVE